MKKSKMVPKPEPTRPNLASLRTAPPNVKCSTFGFNSQAEEIEKTCWNNIEKSWKAQSFDIVLNLRKTKQYQNERANMTVSSIASQTQAGIRVHGQIDTFFNRFRIGTLLHRCGIRKRNGHSVRSLTQAIFTLPFVGQNFYRGIVINPDQPFGKDAA